MERPPEQAAAEVLSTVYGPAPRLPIDPVVVAGAPRMNVWQVTLDNGLSGLISRTAQHGEIDAFIDESHAPVRQRFTTALEIGHSIHHDEVHRPGSPMRYVRDQLSSCGTHADKIYANKFAAALLVPADLGSAYARP